MSATDELKREGAITSAVKQAEINVEHVIQCVDRLTDRLSIALASTAPSPSPNTPGDFPTDPDECDLSIRIRKLATNIAGTADALDRLTRRVEL